MIFFCGSNGANSSKPKDFTAIFINSLSFTPTLRCCFLKKYLPASNNASNGTKPTNSLPVTLKPRAVALSQAVSKTLCSGVSYMLVKLMEICATPYSSINQPIAFTDFNKPASHKGFPAASFIVFPFSSFF